MQSNLKNESFDIATQQIEIEEDYSIFKATVTLFQNMDDGKSLIKQKVSSTAKADSIEKAEDAAVKRALELLSLRGQ